MYCKKCGQEMADNAKFCPRCGAKMGAVEDFKAAAGEMADSAEQSLDSAINEVKDTFNGRDNVGASNRADGDYVVNEPQRLTEDRNFWMYLFLSIITCGIYALYFFYKMAHDINIVCAGDGENTTGLVGYILLTIVTCGIYAFYWEYKFANRLAANASRYGLHFQENGTTILMWDIFGVVLCFVGPYIAMYILIKNTNAICHEYNRINGL